MSTRWTIGEILKKVQTLETSEEKIDFLRKNYSAPLVKFLQAGLDPNVVVLLQDGVPEYKPSPYPVGLAPISLLTLTDKLYLFVKGGRDDLTPEKRWKLFGEHLEVVDSNEVDLLLAFKDRRVHEYVTLEIAQAAFGVENFTFAEPVVETVPNEQLTTTQS